MKKLFFLIFLLSWGAYAESNIQCTKSGYIDLDQSKIYYGASTYIRYDGECRPLKELNRDTWTYQYKKNRDNYEVCKKDKCILLPINKYVRYNFGFDKISISYQYNNISNITDSKSNCKEIILGYSDNWKRKSFKWESDYFLWDEKVNIISKEIKKDLKKGGEELHICKNITNEHGLFIVKDKYLIYQICKENINKDINSYNFIFNSYIIKDVKGNSSWDGGIFINSTIKRTTGILQSNWTNYSSGVVGYWNFDGGSLVDQTGINNGTCSGENCPNMTTGMWGDALEFDGVGDYVDYGDDESLNITEEITISMWMKTTSSTPGYLVSKYGTVQEVPCWLMSTSVDVTHITAKFRDNNNNWIQATGTSTINDGEWHHVVGVKSNITAYIYVDGSLEHSHSNVAIGDITNTKDVLIGRLLDIYSKCTLDEVRIYNRALSPEEINASMYNSKYIKSRYQSKNITSINDSFKSISFNFKKNNAKLKTSYLCDGNWFKISNNTINNYTYNITATNDIIFLLNLSSDNTSKSIEVNEIIINYEYATTTIIILKHKYHKEDTITQKTNNFIDEVNIKHLIIIGLILIVIFFYGICDQLK